MDVPYTVVIQHADMIAASLTGDMITDVPLECRSSSLESGGSDGSAAQVPPI